MAYPKMKYSAVSFGNGRYALDVEHDIGQSYSRSVDPAFRRNVRDYVLPLVIAEGNVEWLQRAGWSHTGTQYGHITNFGKDNRRTVSRYMLELD